MRLTSWRGRGSSWDVFLDVIFFFKKAALGDFALIDSFLEHLINFYQQHFSLVVFSFVFLSLWELQSIAKPTSSPCSGSRLCDLN